MSRALKVKIKGIVQGVGFRPFVYRLACENSLNGWVTNDTTGVEILVSGDENSLSQFLDALRKRHPPQAVIEEIKIDEEPPYEGKGFKIIPSRRDGKREVLISPDLATCPDCLQELFDPEDRRYRYPFINCTNCGPRFTIIKETPYDRPFTSMSAFKMCPDCEREYNDPHDRRYHAQPNACPVCGPRLFLVDNRGSDIPGDPIDKAVEILKNGKILALKGLGGFHLACDATSDTAVTTLRSRKKRYEKPFAIMIRDLDTVRQYCKTSEAEERLLSSPAAPIVLLEEREDSPISDAVAGILNVQGVFLPYTPLHHLLMEEIDFPLVMTSGNVSSEPIVTKDSEALEKLRNIADYFLVHNREIVTRYDDSVVRFFAGGVYPVRRARGYAPYPLTVKYDGNTQVVAFGADLKNTFCVLKKGQGFVSQHIGDMDSASEVEHFREAMSAILRLFSLNPTVAAHDLHPDYVTTRLATELDMPKIAVQHHHAHVVSCSADNEISGEVLGVAFDGTGYGDDGNIWGGEFLIADENDYKRVASLYPYPMPGGDACIYRLYRMLFGILSEALEDAISAADRLVSYAKVDEDELKAMVFQVESGFNAPLTSGAGRLFDAVAVLTGLRDRCVHDGQAAMELEAISSDAKGEYPFELTEKDGIIVADTRHIFSEIMNDIAKCVDASDIAGKFHNTICEIIIEVVKEISSIFGKHRVVLSGGVFQNVKLTGLVLEKLKKIGFDVFVHRRVPCNDGGISLGQAIIAAHKFNQMKE